MFYLFLPSEYSGILPVLVFIFIFHSSGLQARKRATHLMNQRAMTGACAIFSHTIY
ncbi:unnamed protein product [Tuber melanosporum]|uniref:(Perigord truffle) hypothetical protein n=1 Tax=Tuber melanosporum (strain Mel28) TaxID=656061 RepID=D5GCK1_TUBMM|nr:uncharacterized protein GSTUM_00000666001 [Tuber melanosporum]CAZ82244.1 unnamed protein product [Tuber melanosporum]